MRTEIRCSNESEGSPCERFLALVEGATVRIFCAKCKGFHDVRIPDLVAMAFTALEVEKQADKGTGKTRIFL